METSGASENSQQFSVSSRVKIFENIYLEVDFNTWRLMHRFLPHALLFASCADLSNIVQPVSNIVQPVPSLTVLIFNKQLHAVFKT